MRMGNPLHDATAGVEPKTGPAGQWPSFRDPRLLLLLRHWAERRRGLVMPRSALDPAAIKTCLPHVWLFRYDAADDSFTCRLSGEGVNEAWGTNMTGKRPRDFMPEASAAMAHRIYRRILLTPALHVSNKLADATSKGADRLVVPLIDDDGQPYGIFGLSIYHFDPISGAGLPPHVGPEITYYPCADLPATPP